MWSPPKHFVSQRLNPPTSVIKAFECTRRQWQVKDELIDGGDKVAAGEETLWAAASQTAAANINNNTCTLVTCGLLLEEHNTIIALHSTTCVTLRLIFYVDTSYLDHSANRWSLIKMNFSKARIEPRLFGFCRRMMDHVYPVNLSQFALLYSFLFLRWNCVTALQWLFLFIYFILFYFILFYFIYFFIFLFFYFILFCFVLFCFVLYIYLFLLILIFHWTFSVLSKP